MQVQCLGRAGLLQLKRWVGALVALLVVGCGGGGDSAEPSTEALQAALARPTPAPLLTTLQPGQVREIQQTLKVNVVFVGFGPGAIDSTAFAKVLPAGYRSLVRVPRFYGLEQPTGNRFNFDYNVVHADTAYADRLFARLASTARPVARTNVQNFYNGTQPGAVRVTTNHEISAADTEAWLALNPPAGVDTSQYTIYLINWWGRADFRFHVYSKLDSPDPDTGRVFGTAGTRKLVAWGGTPNQGGTGKRVWFYDFSAGPEFTGGQFVLDAADIDGDGQADYRIPVIWDYGNPNAYRKLDTLSQDAGLLVRYVAINQLFTTSPIYNPVISAPRVPSAINLDLNLYQGDVTSDALNWMKPDMAVNHLGELQAHNTFRADMQSWPFSSQVASNYLCFLSDRSCYGQRIGDSFGDLFLYHQSHLNQYLDAQRDYEVPVFSYNLPSELSSGLLGFADDNWADGTQSYVFGFSSPSIRSAGYGFTTTTIHEVGHHLGLSHPHDGFDAESGLDYEPSGSKYFAWLGDESASMMSYIDLTWTFSQFDRDNMDRYLTAGYINQANAILARIDVHPQAGSQASALLQADARAAQALTQYQAMNYRGAVAMAKLAYETMLGAAAAMRIQVEPQAVQADYRSKGKSNKFVDSVHSRLRYDHEARLRPFDSGP